MPAAHRRAVRFDDLGRDVVVAEGVENRHRLGRREGQIPARYAVRAGVAAELRRRPRVDAAENLPQIVVGDLAVETEPGGARTRPLPGRLAAARVVVLDALGDRRQVVVLLASAELADGEHGARRLRSLAVTERARRDDGGPTADSGDARARRRKRNEHPRA